MALILHAVTSLWLLSWAAFLLGKAIARRAGERRPLTLFDGP